METNLPENPPLRGWILYDGSCGFCCWWVPFWGGVLARHGFGMAELQAHWVQERIPGPPDALLRDIRLLSLAGKCISGADVYREVMRHVWWLTPFYWITILPLGRQLFDLGYKLFNKNRYRVSRVCRLPAKNKDSSLI